MVLLLSGILSSTLSNIVHSKKKHHMNTLVLNSVQLGVGGVVLFISGLIFEGIPSLYQPISYYRALIYISFVSAMAFSIWYKLLQKVKVSDLNVWKFLIPVVGASLSWWLIPEESPDVVTLLGMMLIISSLFLINRMPIKPENATI
jgi:drug/metabolite transporter (DMT)-like permease